LPPPPPGISVTHFASPTGGACGRPDAQRLTESAEAVRRWVFEAWSGCYSIAATVIGLIARHSRHPRDLSLLALKAAPSAAAAIIIPTVAGLFRQKIANNTWKVVRLRRLAVSWSVITIIRLGLPRVLEYSSTTRVVNYSSNCFTSRVLVTFYFQLQISISGSAFFATIDDELLEFMETWGFAVSFATCQPGNRS